MVVMIGSGIGSGVKSLHQLSNNIFSSPIPRWDCASGPRGALEKCRCVCWDTILQYFAYFEAIRKPMRAHLLTDMLSILFFEDISDSRRQDTAPETQDVKPDNVLFVDAAYLQGTLEMALACADLIGWEQDIMDITGNSVGFFMVHTRLLPVRH